MHKEVAPLLQQLSRNTRVLFHAETARERLGVQPEGPFRSARDVQRRPLRLQREDTAALPEEPASGRTSQRHGRSNTRRGPGGGEGVERESRGCVVVGLDAAAPPGDRPRV